MRRRWRRLLSLSARQWWVVVQSLLLVPGVQASMWHSGFQRTAAILARWSDRPARDLSVKTPAESSEEALRLADAVGIVAGRRIIGAKCLGRSLVVWFLLRRRGIDAELLIGAQPPVDGVLPAHAWVEVGGAPVGDAADVRGKFGSFGIELPRLRPSAPT